MPNRDYAARSKKSSKGVNKPLILVIILLLLGASALALWALKATKPVTSPSEPIQINAAQSNNKAQLPSEAQEQYNFIRDLETREVPVDKNSKLAQLTKEQEQLLQRQKEEEKRKQELAEQQLLAQQQAQQAAQNGQQNATVQTAETETVVEQAPQQPKVVALTPEELAAKKAQEQKLAEEKRKQAELKKQQEAKKAEQQLAQQAQKTKEQQQLALKEQQIKEQQVSSQAKAEQEKAAELAKQKAAKEKEAKEKEAQKIVAKPAAEAPKVVGKFGLQCGAFKNKAQAENMQARLAMAGYNARINSNGEWNRVVVGPIGDRASASSAQSNARSVAECLIVGM